MKNRRFHALGNTECFVVLLSHTKRFIITAKRFLVTTKIETSPCAFYKKPNIEKAKQYEKEKRSSHSKSRKLKINHTFICPSEINRKKTAFCGFLAVFSFIWSQSLDG